MSDPDQQPPPHNREAEEGLVACALLDPDVLTQCVEMRLEPDDFFDMPCRILWEGIVALYWAGDPIEEIGLMERLRRDGGDEAVGGIEGLMRIQNRVETAVHWPYFAKLVREKSMLRSLIRTARQTIEQCAEQGDITEILGELERRAREMSEHAQQRSSVVTAAELAEQCEQDIRAALDPSEDDVPQHVVPTPLADLNAILPRGGFLPGELIVLAARPSLGKTSLAMNIAEVAATDYGHDTLVFSLEMTPDSLMFRAACSRSRVNSKDVHDRLVSGGDQRRLATAVREIGAAPLYVDGMASHTPATLRATATNVANRISRKGRSLRLIVVDYLQLIQGTDPKANRNEQIEEISRMLKLLARELKLPVVMLSQLNREPERQNREPQLSDLKSGGSIEQDADVALFLHRMRDGGGTDSPDAPDTDEIETIKLIHAKVRNGPVGFIKTTFRRRITRFENYATRS